MHYSQLVEFEHVYTIKVTFHYKIYKIEFIVSFQGKFNEINIY